MEQKKYVIDDENKEPIEVSADEYINYLFGIIKSETWDKDLGARLRMEYNFQRLAQLLLFNKDIEETA